jgi:hypothetical protein
VARIRTIKPEFFDDPKIGRLSPVVRLCFIGLLTQADREGRIEDEPDRLKVRILPFDALNMDVVLRDLSSAGVIVRYECDGKRVIQVKNFEKHQRPHPKEAPSLLPKPAVKRNGKPRKETASREKDSTSRVDTGVLDTGVLDTGVLQVGTSPDGDDFAAFWDAWPDGHRVTKKQAVEQWGRLSAADRETVLTEVRWRVLHDATWQAPREDGRWAIPHPFRYLRDRRFTDARNSTTPAHSGTTARPAPVYVSDDWCQHDPPCNSREWHVVRLAGESDPPNPEAAT